MKTFPAGLRQAGSLIAGALIGLAMVVMVFTITATETSQSQIFLALGSSIVFAVGFMLQIVMTGPRGPHAIFRHATAGIDPTARPFPHG